MSTKGTKPIQLDNVPIEIMMQYQDDALITATNVFQCATHNQSQIFTIHGPHSIHERKDEFPRIGQSHTPGITEFSCIMGQIIQISQPTPNISLILDGLDSNTVIIHGKVNHVLIRKSQNVTLDIKYGTVSGVDILYCNKMCVKMPYHNFTNLEYGEAIYFEAEINSVSQLHITGSLDVRVNGISVPINPFVSAIFGEGGWSYKKRHELPKLMICKY
ncbi:Hypothetical protein HVR_LOCUS1356 [uncultured virus]|nr:Hypothetical protein HVR_LOCUS1356 [uncultured virus]